MIKIKLPRILKKFIIIFFDIICILLSLILSYSLRLETFYNPTEINVFIYAIFLVVIILSNYLFGVYSIIIRYFNFNNVINIFKSIFTSGFILVLINLAIYKTIFIPRSVSFIAIIIIFLSAIIVRVILNFILNFKFSLKKKAILVGVSKNSTNIVNLSKNSESKISIVSIIDISGDYEKTKVNGISVLKLNNIKNILNRYMIDYVILDEQFDNLTKKNFFINNFKDKNLRLINLEQGLKLVQGVKYNVNNNLNFNDILNKEKFLLKKKLLHKKLKNKSILVTGAGGSIGSELVKQIKNHQPAKIYLVDNSEIGLFNLYNEILSKNPRYYKILEIILCDCNQINILKKKLKGKKIDIIFHAAAYKHLWFGEINQNSMLFNNINSTIQMLKIALSQKVKDFIFISSDKAVNPKSILGISKKIGEDIVFYFYKYVNKYTNYSIVRFGNVIGSSGSVIPKFIEQINAKNYITVSHKKAKRYFMSIHEAVYLTLYSTSFTNKFNIFALDMGEQIYIYDIAKRIIQLSGKSIKTKSRGGDIEIRLTGLKKGEKLKEEISLGKNLQKTTHPKIFKCNEVFDIKKVKINYNKINKIIKNNNKIIKKTFIDEFN